MIHTIELMQPVYPDTVQEILQQMSRVDSRLNPDADLATLTARLRKDADDGDYLDDIAHHVTFADYDATTKHSHAARFGAGINRFKIIRITSRSHQDAAREHGVLNCSFYAILELNPHTMANPADTFTIRLYEATPEHNDVLEHNFHRRMHDIFGENPLLTNLCDFRAWDCHRIDYTCNLKFQTKDEFDLFWKLTHKTSKYARTERKRLPGIKSYDQSAAEGNKSYKTLFYDKHAECIERYGHIQEPTRSRILGESQNVIRMEQQCKKGKIAALKKKHGFPDRKAWRFLREDIARDVLLERYDKMIGDGDFYHREKAKAIIREKVPQKSMQDRLIQLLQLIAEKRHIDVAQRVFTSCMEDGDKFPLAHGTVKTFRERIKAIRALGINPVLIEDACTVKHLRNPKHFIMEEN